ncbi:hypothetical protein [Spelaeicoccus albus]|uniref:TadE-like protein n=1 Tax=Spelaeicoccus albus TaxID=1280376 RepID=A0A7Z0D5H9_9MICO|nr:hypothetical protein [Spelaeicoccus albus]NYI69265.1 hypothetical protein [Spelaeicoccus albus]
MTARPDAAPDGGSAVIEFSVAGLILLIPLIYLVVTLGRLQAASYAVTSAATAASAVTSRAADTAPTGAARQAAVLALRDHGFADAERSVAITCDPSCTAPRAVVTARVTLDVSLPGAPAAFAATLPTHITVTAHHTDEVAAYGYRP